MNVNDAFCILQISWSTLSKMLAFISKQESPIISSACGKKKKKINVQSSYNVISKGEDALSFLSSLLDILLLKKDIADRSAFSFPFCNFLLCWCFVLTQTN